MLCITVGARDIKLEQNLMRMKQVDWSILWQTKKKEKMFFFMYFFLLTPLFFSLRSQQGQNERSHGLWPSYADEIRMLAMYQSPI